MHIYSAWNLDASQILSRSELASVLADLKGRSRLPNSQMNLAIVRLACCCGLRASEIGGLTLRDAVLGVGRPHLVVRAEFAEGARPRRVPLWWIRGHWPTSSLGSATAKTTATGRPIRSFVRSNGRRMGRA